MLKRLIATVAAILMASTPVYGQQLTNEGGNVKQPVTATLPQSVTGQKASMPATAVYSASVGRAWDPLTDGISTSVVGGGTTVKATAVAPTYVEGSTTNPLSTDLSGGLRVSGSISATSATKSTAADPSYTEGVTTNPVSVDLAGYARTLAKQAGTWNVTNISGTVSLPTGAATAAKQPALGTAGTPSTDVITVQGRSGMTAVVVDGSAVTQPISGSLTNISGTVSLPTGASTAANQSTIITNQTNVTGSKAAGTAAANALLIGGVFNSTPPTLTNGQQAALQFDSTGSLKVAGGGGGTQYAEDATHVSGDIGTQMLTVRADTVAAISSAAGDYQPLTTDASGRLWVNCSTGCSGGTQFPEDAVAASADVGTTALAVRDDTPAGKTSANGDYTTLVTDSLSRLWVNNVANASAFADGWDLTQGTKADAAWTSGSGSAIALLKAIAGAALDTTTPTPVKLDQTTPGTTNGVVVNSSALPTGASTEATLAETHGTKAAGTAATKSELGGGVFNTSLPTLTNGQQAAIQMDSSGRTLVSDTQAQTKLDTLNTSINSSVPAGSAIIGKVGIDQTTLGTTNGVTPVPMTTGGLSTCRVVTGTTGFCKASAGTTFHVIYQNTNAAVRYLHIYNKASAPTLSTDTPIATVQMALTSRGEADFSVFGISGSNGIAWAVTTDDVAIPTTAGTSGDLHMTLAYK